MHAGRAGIPRFSWFFRASRDYSALSWVFPRFWRYFRAFLGFSALLEIIPRFPGFFRASGDISALFWFFPRFLRLFRAFPGFSALLTIFPRFPGFFRDSGDISALSWVFPRFSRLFRAFLVFPRFPSVSRGTSRFLALFCQHSSDDEALDFICSFINLSDFGIPHVAFDWVILCIAVSAKYLNCLHRCTHCSIACK